MFWHTLSCGKSDSIIVGKVPALCSCAVLLDITFGCLISTTALDPPIAMLVFMCIALLMLPGAVVSTVLPSTPYGPAASHGNKVSYDGYRVYRIDIGRNTPSTLEETLKAFHTIHTRNYVEVAVPPSEVLSFERLGLEGVELINDDLGRDIAAEAIGISSSSSSSSYDPQPPRKPGELPDLSWFDTYHSYDDHLQYWTDLQASFPENSELFDAGPSYEGRRIFGLQLWGDKAGDTNNDTSKPIILWHATVHAREWISTAVSVLPDRLGLGSVHRFLRKLDI